ncbi:hypothetical protein VPHD51_0215 [Vibrio phage D51]
MSRNRRFTILILAVGYLEKSLRMAYRSFWEVYGKAKKLARYFPSQKPCQQMKNVKTRRSGGKLHETSKNLKNGYISTKYEMSR